MVMGRAPDKGIKLRWNKYRLTTITVLGGMLFCNKGLQSELGIFGPTNQVYISAYELKSKLFKGAI